MNPPGSDETWVGLTDESLPIGEVYEWCVVPRCGAVVLFSGTVRDHSVDEGAADDDAVDEGAVDDVVAMRDDVQFLEYEAYTEHAEASFRKIVDELRSRWPHTGRVALLHRVGRLTLGESSVVAAVSAPHRPEAFEAARYAIDALKASAPIWKRETWSSDATSAWGTGAHAPVDPATVPSARASTRSS